MARPPSARPKTQRHEEVADALHSAAIHLLRRLRRLDDKAELPAPQLSALSVLVFGGPATLGALAAAEQVRPATMTHVVRQLETANLVVRAADPEDARKTILQATPAARELLRQGRGRRVQALAAYVATLPSGQQETLAKAARLMEKFAERELE